MRGSLQRSLSLVIIACWLFAGTGTTAKADGFFDQGFAKTPVVRTDFLAHSAGTAANPLRVSGCHFGQDPCPVEQAVWPQSNTWSQNYPAHCVPGFTCPTRWWTLIMNNEPRDADGNSGPPDASLPHVAPGSGIMGFSTVLGDDNFPGDTHWRAHLVLNGYWPNPVTGAIPYLGFGAFAQGNGGPIAMLNRHGAATRLDFDSRLWGSALPAPCCGPGTTQLETLTSWLTVIASWGSHPRMIQIAIFHRSRDPQHPDQPDPYLGNGPVPHNFGVPFDWRYTDSVLYPGALLLTLVAEDLGSYCGFDVPTLEQGADVHYAIDLQRLYECMDDHGLFDEPFRAAGPVPVTAVFWANEITGVDGYLWTDVHGMRMTTP